MASRKSSKKSKVNETVAELEILSTAEMNTLKPIRAGVNMEDVKNAAEFIKTELVDKTNDEGAPLFVNMMQLHERFNLKPFHSKKHDKYWLNGRLHAELHKKLSPAIWCRYLRREDKTTFIHFYSKPEK